MGVLSSYSEHRDLVDLVRQQVGHQIHFVTAEGDVVGIDRAETVWRVLPAEEATAHDFLYWYKSCNRQWFPTAEEAASAYCAKWREWHRSTSKEVDYSADTIEYRP